MQLQRIVAHALHGGGLHHLIETRRAHAKTQPAVRVCHAHGAQRVHQEITQGVLRRGVVHPGDVQASQLPQSCRHMGVVAQQGIVGHRAGQGQELQPRQVLRLRLRTAVPPVQ